MKTCYYLFAFYLGCCTLFASGKNPVDLEIMIANCGNQTKMILDKIKPKMKFELNPHLKNKCYNSTVNGINIDIFQEDVNQIVTKFFKAFPNQVDKSDNKITQKRVCSFLNNLVHIRNEVLKCIKNCTENANFAPTKLGLTELAVYNETELHKMLNPQLKDYIQRKKQQKLGNSQNEEKVPNDPNSCNLIKNDTNLPDSFDLREYNVVTKVKRQLCGDCYVHAAMAALETMYLMTVKNSSYIKKLNDIASFTFSRQDPLNCVRSGCAGGTPDLVMKELAYRGLVLETVEPYTGKQANCSVKLAQTFYTPPLHYCQTEAKSDDEIKSLLYHHGPLTAAIASEDIPALLKGVFNGLCKDKVENLDHQVLLIGWTRDGYWILKNSYGSNYGIDGYLYLLADVPNKCGLQHDLLFPYFGDNIYLEFK